MDSKVIRLQKFLAGCELCSRRKAEDLIRSLCVTVNEKIASIGDLVSPSKDIVKVNGEQIKQYSNPSCLKTPTVFMLNKPKGYICSHRGNSAEKTIFDLIPRRCYKNRLFFCGRLDKNTTGLMLLSNSGEFVQKISHPSANVKKHYEVIISKPLSNEVKSKFFEGINDRGQFIKFDKIFPTGKGEFKYKAFTIILSQGRKNEIHRMFGRFGYFVEKLHRVRIGNLCLRGIGVGTFKRLSEKEIELLFK
jgi:pseudouridine synthase